MMLSCKQASELISQQQDHPLSFIQRVNLGFHLAMCSSCNFVSKQLKGLSSLMEKACETRDEPYASLEATLPEISKERINALFNDQRS